MPFSDQGGGQAGCANWLAMCNWYHRSSPLNCDQAGCANWQFCNQVFSIVIFLELLQDLKWKFVWIWRHCALFSICALQWARHATWFLCFVQRFSIAFDNGFFSTLFFWLIYTILNCFTGLVKKLPMISFPKGPATLKPTKMSYFWSHSDLKCFLKTGEGLNGFLQPCQM